MAKRQGLPASTLKAAHKKYPGNPKRAMKEAWRMHRGKSRKKTPSRKTGSKKRSSRKGGAKKGGKSMSKNGFFSKVRWGGLIGSLAGLFTPHFYAAGGETGPLFTAINGNFQHAWHQLMMNYTGYDTYGNMKNGIGDVLKRARGLHALAIGCGISYVVAKLGLNRYTPKWMNI